MEHGRTVHFQLYDEVMHIPMMVRWPRKVPAGTRIDTPVSLVDIMPTGIDQLPGAKQLHRELMPYRARALALTDLDEPARQEPSEDVDPARREKLRQLGYIE